MIENARGIVSEIKSFLVNGGYSGQGFATNMKKIWKNCERKIAASLQMAALAFVSLLLKQALRS